LEELMAVDFDFSMLDAMDVLDLACFIEQEAAQNYVLLASWAEKNSPEAAKFFHRMVKLENQHDSQLEERRRALFGDKPPRYIDSAPWEVEVPDFDEVGTSFTLDEAYRLALGAEERAEAFFTKAVEYIADPQTVAVLETLAEEEREHQRFLKIEMARH
jgi:rubrerythrin